MLLNLINIIMLAADKCSLHWSALGHCHRRWLLHKQGYLHGHIFTSCFTTGRGPGVGVEWKKNCWLTCRHNNVLCGTQVVWTTCCNIHWYCMMTAFKACTIAVQIWRCVAAVPLMHIHSLPATYTVSYAILGSNYADICLWKTKSEMLSTYIDLWTTYHGKMSTCISSDDAVHTYMLSGHVCPWWCDDGTTQCNGIALVPLSR